MICWLLLVSISLGIMHSTKLGCCVSTYWSILFYDTVRYTGCLTPNGKGIRD